MDAGTAKKEEFFVPSLGSLADNVGLKLQAAGDGIRMACCSVRSSSLWLRLILLLAPPVWSLPTMAEPTMPRCPAPQISDCGARRRVIWT